MRSLSESPSIVSTENRGNGMSEGATHCIPGVHAAAARGIWPSKTAFHWAEAAGVQERMAKYWLAGTHDVSADGKLAIIRLLD